MSMMIDCATVLFVETTFNGVNIYVCEACSDQFPAEEFEFDSETDPGRGHCPNCGETHFAEDYDPTPWIAPTKQ